LHMTRIVVSAAAVALRPAFVVEQVRDPKFRPFLCVSFG
jgi:hypothetical protein